MSDVATLKRRIRAHPAFKGGTVDEGYWLDWMEFVLGEFGSYDDMVEAHVETCEQHPDVAFVYIDASRESRMAWDVLRALVPKMRRAGKQVPSALLEWWVDSDPKVRVREAPTQGGRVSLRNAMRNAIIATTVRGIRNATDLPYSFDESKSNEPLTASHVVANRLRWKYARVKSIWDKERPFIERAREQRIIPAARPRKRRTRTQRPKSPTWVFGM